MNFMSIDPGLSGTGWAAWEGEIPTSCGVLKPKKEVDWTENAYQISFAVCLLVRKFRPLETLIEFPRYMPGSSAGRASAASGSLIKLAFLVGSITNKVTPYTDVRLIGTDWKGNLKKDIMQRRVERELGISLCQKLDVKTHAWDALGIGLNKIGRF